MKRELCYRNVSQGLMNVRGRWLSLSGSMYVSIGLKLK